VTCSDCGRDMPIIDGHVVDGLGEPSPDVVQEIKGMMEESVQDFDGWRDFLVHEIPVMTRQAEREESGRAHAARNYYLSIRLNLDRALELSPPKKEGSVLEIGGQDDFPFLLPFRDAGCRCICTNLFFRDDPRKEFRDWPEKVLGDMDNLPFRDGCIDAVMMSATSHHSPSLDLAISEVARVLKPGGTAYILNDPVGGLLKNVWTLFAKGFRHTEDRGELIHENEYTIGTYKRLFRKHGLVLEHSFFSVFYDQRLKSGDVKGVRFWPVAKVISWFWRIPPCRWFFMKVGLPVGQAILGLEMNVILRKQGH
jgi:SAM-dependent methyltransferase